MNITIKQWLKVGRKYAIKEKVCDEDGMWRVKVLIVRLEGMYPHLAAFRDGRGLMRTYKYWDIKQMMRERKFMEVPEDEQTD